MRQTSSSTSDFEIFKITSTTAATQLTTNSTDDTHVSITRGTTIQGFPSYKMAWETNVSCGLFCTKRGIQVRSVGLGSSDSFLTFGTGDLTQPTLSGNGQYLAYIRKATDQQRVGRYRFSTSSAITIASSGSGLFQPSFSDPSVSDDGTKVVYRSRGQIVFPDVNYSIKLSTNGVITNVVSGVPMSHPHMTADGKYITYAKQVSGAYRIVTRSLITNLEVDATAPASPRNHYAPFWQKANP